eukprot:789739-Pyramimonas_sp.AAC.1
MPPNALWDRPFAAVQTDSVHSMYGRMPPRRPLQHAHRTVRRPIVRNPIEGVCNAGHMLPLRLF